MTLTADGRPFSARVVGRHIEPDDDGLGVVALAGTVPAASLRRPSWVAARWPTASTPRAPRRRSSGAGAAQLIVDRPGESLEREVGEMRPIVYGVTALLLAIAGVNLLTTLLLGVRERRRDVAILGAVGASRRQVTGTVVTRRPAARRCRRCSPDCRSAPGCSRRIVGITDPVATGPTSPPSRRGGASASRCPVALVAVGAAVGAGRPRGGARGDRRSAAGRVSSLN